VIFLVHRARPSDDIAARWMITTKSTATPTEMNRAGRLLGKFSNQSVKIVTAGRCYQTASMD
jgi:hypothetical protein